MNKYIQIKNYLVQVSDDHEQKAQDRHHSLHHHIHRKHPEEEVSEWPTIRINRQVTNGFRSKKIMKQIGRDKQFQIIIFPHLQSNNATSEEIKKQQNNNVTKIEQIIKSQKAKNNCISSEAIVIKDKNILNTTHKNLNIVHLKLPSDNLPNKQQYKRQYTLDSLIKLQRIRRKLSLQKTTRDRNSKQIFRKNSFGYEIAQFLSGLPQKSRFQNH